MARSVRDAAGRAQRDSPMDELRYPGLQGAFGGGPGHAATGPDGRRLALPGRCAGAFKIGARDAWIGPAPEQRFRRLPLAANNCRFPVPAEGRVPNLASRVPALSMRRLPKPPGRNAPPLKPATPAPTLPNGSAGPPTPLPAAGFPPGSARVGLRSSRLRNCKASLIEPAQGMDRETAAR